MSKYIYHNKTKGTYTAFLSSGWNGSSRHHDNKLSDYLQVAFEDINYYKRYIEDKPAIHYYANSTDSKQEIKDVPLKQIADNMKKTEEKFYNETNKLLLDIEAEKAKLNIQRVSKEYELEIIRLKKELQEAKESELEVIYLETLKVKNEKQILNLNELLEAEKDKGSDSYEYSDDSSELSSYSLQDRLSFLEGRLESKENSVNGIIDHYKNVVDGMSNDYSTLSRYTSSINQSYFQLSEYASTAFVENRTLNDRVEGLLGEISLQVKKKEYVNDKYSLLKSALSTLKSVYKNSETQRNQKEDELQMQIRNSESLVKAKKKELADVQSNLNESEKNKNELQQETQQLSEEIKELNYDMDIQKIESDNKNWELLEEVWGLRGQKEEWDQDEMNLLVERSNLWHAEHGLKKDLLDLSLQKKKLVKKYSELKEKLRTTQEKLTASEKFAEDSIAKGAVEIFELKEHISVLNNDLKNAKDFLVNKDKTIQDLNDDLDTQKFNTEIAVQQKKLWTKAYSELEEKLAASEKFTDESREKSDFMMLKLKKQIDISNEDFENAKDALANQYEVISQKASDLWTELYVSKRKCALFEGRNEWLSKENKILIEAVVEKKSLLHEKSKEISALEEKLLELEVEMAYYGNSDSSLSTSMTIEEYKKLSNDDESHDDFFETDPAELEYAKSLSKSLSLLSSEQGGEYLNEKFLSLLEQISGFAEATLSRVEEGDQKNLMYFKIAQIQTAIEGAQLLKSSTLEEFIDQNGIHPSDPSTFSDMFAGVVDDLSDLTGSASSLVSSIFGE